MVLEIGRLAKVIGNKSYHGFVIGEEVILYKIDWTGYVWVNKWGYEWNITGSNIDKDLKLI